MSLPTPPTEKKYHPKTVLLQGDPGTGKTMMIVKTALHRPVHVIDVDRKIESAEWAQPFLDNGQLTVSEVAEAIDDSNLKGRLDALVGKITSAGPTIPPQGWTKFAEIFHNLVRNKEAMAAGTWCVDSATLLNEHAKAHIMMLAKRSKFTFDQWNALKIAWMDTFSFTRDLAKAHGKDLMWTVHERDKDVAGDRTTGVALVPVSSADGEVTVQRQYQGTQDVEVWASIDGAFGGLIAAQTDESYHLYVDANNRDAPRWRCRVWPDGRRTLRTTFPVTKAVHNCDFREIWK